MSDDKRAARSQSGNETQTLRMELGVDFINTLNDDCLAEIFTYLSIEDRLRVPAVCKRWREKSDLVWRDMRTLNFESRKIPERLKRIQAIRIILKKSGNYLRQLKIRDDLGRAVLPLIAVHCPNLMWLHIELKGSNCIEFWALMTRLEYLSIIGSSSNFSQNFFDTLSCRNLINLTLSSTARSNSPNAARLSPTIFDKLPKLSILSMKNFHLTEDALMAIFRNPNLVHLTLKFCSTGGKFPSLNVISLEHLEIVRMDTITDSFLCQVSKISKNLRYLKLMMTPEVTDAGLIKLGELPKLKELDINCNYSITDKPFSRLHSLRRLYCNDCIGVRDNGIITVMKYAPNLQYLDLRFSGITKGVLTEASKIVRERSNDLELRIIVTESMKSEWEPEDVPPLLVVKTGEEVIMSSLR